MRRELAIIGGTAGLLILAACGSTTAGTGSSNSPTATAAPTATPTLVATPTPVPPAAGATVSLRSVGSLGQILVGTNGKTVYVFLADTGMTSTCNGSCAQNWPPLTTTGTAHATGGVSQALLGTTKRADGTTQVTYHGHPIYYFIADTGPGTANGEGLMAFGALWQVVNAAGMSK